MQRVIDDVQSEAANAAEMKAAASGNPLILMQMQLAAVLRKLEALYSQHQRGQHRLRDRLKWLEGTDARLAAAEADHAANLRCRDANTHIVREKDKEKIRIGLRTDEGLLTDKDGDKMKDLLLGCVKEVTRNVGAKALFGSYRGFAMHIVRYTQPFGGKDGFRIVVSGPGEQEFRPDNLIYTFDDKLSLSGLFLRWTTSWARDWTKAWQSSGRNADRKRPNWQPYRTPWARSSPRRRNWRWHARITAPSSANGSGCRTTPAMSHSGRQRRSWGKKKVRLEDINCNAYDAKDRFREKK